MSQKAVPNHYIATENEFIVEPVSKCSCYYPGLKFVLFGYWKCISSEMPSFAPGGLALSAYNWYDLVSGWFEPMCRRMNDKLEEKIKQIYLNIKNQNADKAATY